MTAGYSRTSLAKKLGIEPGFVVAVLNDPGSFLQLTDPLPPDVTIRYGARGKADIAILFTRSRSELERRLDALGRMVYPDGAIWVGWPKRASKVTTDMAEDAVLKGVSDIHWC